MSLKKMERSIRRGGLKKLVVTLVFSMAVLGMLPDVSWAAVSPAADAAVKADQRAENVESIRAALERKEVAARLADYGLTPEEVDARLGELSDDQVAEIAAHTDLVNTGGDVLGTVLYILLVVIVIVIILRLIRADDAGTKAAKKKAGAQD